MPPLPLVLNIISNSVIQARQTGSNTSILLPSCLVVNLCLWKPLIAVYMYSNCILAYILLQIVGGNTEGMAPSGCTINTVDPQCQLCNNCNTINSNCNLGHLHVVIILYYHPQLYHVATKQSMLHVCVQLSLQQFVCWTNTLIQQVLLQLNYIISKLLTVYNRHGNITEACIP